MSELPNDYEMLLNWLDLNERIAKLVRYEEEKRKCEAGDNVRVVDLRPIWNEYFQNQEKKSKGGFQNE